MRYLGTEAKIKIVDAAVRDVFERMLWEECRLSNVDWAEGERVFAWIQMRGEADGSCGVEIAASCGDVLADALLGSEGDWDDELIDDAVGELCNMITGGVKSRLGVTPGACAVSLPSVMRFGGGSRPVTSPRGAPLGDESEGTVTIRRMYWFGQASTLAVTLQLGDS